MTRGVLGYMVDASSRLSKHTLSYDRLGRATDHYFGSDDAGNTHRMRWQYSYDDSNAGRLTAIASSNDDGLSSGGTTSHYCQYDHRGNVVAVSDSSGDIQYGYLYDAFGNIMFSFDEGAAAAPTDDILFTGKDYDADTGMYYFNARWYDPEIGRYISKAGVAPAGEHAYLFCQGNPISTVDVAGDLPESIENTRDFIQICAEDFWEDWGWVGYQAARGFRDACGVCAYPLGRARVLNCDEYSGPDDFSKFAPDYIDRKFNHNLYTHQIKVAGACEVYGPNVAYLGFGAYEIWSNFGWNGSFWDPTKDKSDLCRSGLEDVFKENVEGVWEYMRWTYWPW